MKNKRRKKRIDVPYRFTEKGLCAWCGNKLPGRKLRWCSEDCVYQYGIRAWPSYTRSKVFDRDKGVCAHCGINTRDVLSRVKDLTRRANEAIKAAEKENGEWSGRYAARLWLRNEAAYVLRQAGFEKAADRLLRSPQLSISHLWEADHIVPICEGGDLDLENIRTLCVPCHKKETAKLAKRRAKRRRNKER